MEDIIKNTVNNCKVIDLHTHLFPYQHIELCLYGIDNLLTYHYLISELFIVWNGLTPEEFYKLDKMTQADIIWAELFIKRSPISEACRGVVTTLNKLGLYNFIKPRDLNGIRNYLSNINSSNINDYIEQVFELSGVDYTIMTNQIFDKCEVEYLDKIFTFNKGDNVIYKKNGQIDNVDIIECHCAQGDARNYSIVFEDGKEKNTLWEYLFINDSKFKKMTKRFKTSMRIDQLIKDYNNCINNNLLSKYGFSQNLDGVKDYIRFWNHFLRPEYFMASLEYDFCYDSSDIDREWIGSPSQVIDKIIIPLAKELNLPIAFKFGTRRGLNTSLQDGGDSLGVCNMDSLSNLCKTHPKCKFLVTFLSQVNQHQLCVLSRNFPNLHIYGCWWFLNNPSLIEQITRMRIEMLGLGFTAQHSDSRVLEQLLYKWDHSRKIITRVLIDKYKDLQESGWLFSKEDIERDVNYLFKDSYLSFMKKKLI